MFVFELYFLILIWCIIGKFIDGEIEVLEVGIKWLGNSKVGTFILKDIMFLFFFIVLCMLVLEGRVLLEIIFFNGSLKSRISVYK